MSDEQAPSTDHEAPEGASSRGTWDGPSGPIHYTAEAGWTVLRKADEPIAELFSASYLVEGEGRPVTFVFNGGPGASSAYLHMGAVGPKRVDMPADGSLPTMPPRLVTNEASWIPFTDLVFIDPIGTGFSRIIRKDDDKEKERAGDPKQFFGIQRDLESIVEFMGRWLSDRDRWGAPVFIAGESYGGYRVGRLARMAQEAGGIGLNGAILISPALEVTPLAPTDYDMTGWIDTLPVMALSAAHHGRSRVFGPDDDAATVMAEAERFATGDYAMFLTRGAAMPDVDRLEVLNRQADLLGLPLSLIDRAEGRIPIRRFARELLLDERKVVGLYDATVAVTDPFPDRETFLGPDPTLSGANAAFTTAVNRMLRTEIGVDTNREYMVLSYEVNTEWKVDTPNHAFAPTQGATDDFRYGMALNPHMRAFITHGRHDLVTPYFASDRLRNLMRLDQDMESRLTVEHFDGGHMFYAREESRVAFSAAIEAFVAEALAAD
jgi:carboxypeptidase C (cathepsin A)